MLQHNEGSDLKFLNEFLTNIINNEDDLYQVKYRNEMINDAIKNKTCFTKLKIRTIKLFNLLLVFLSIIYFYYYYIYVKFILNILFTFISFLI